MENTSVKNPPEKQHWTICTILPRSSLLT